MKTVLRLVAALCAGLVLAGCWDRVELTDLQMVTAAAFDAAPAGGLRVTLSIVLPASLQSPGGGAMGSSSSSGGTPATAIVSAQGGTLAEAISALALQVPGHIFWGHARVILIGAGLAARGIAPVVDFLMRSRAARLSTDMVVTRGLAATVLTAAPAYSTPGSDALFEALRLRFVPRAPIYRVAQSLLNPTTGILIPEAAVRQPSPPGGGSGGGGAAGSSATPTGFAVAGAGAFAGGRLRGWLTQSQVRGALWLLGSTVESSMRLDAPHGVVVTAKLTHVRFSRDAIRLPGGEAAVQVQVEIDDTLTQVDAGSPPLSSAGYLLMLSDLLAAQIRQQAEAALSLARAGRVDFLGFGRLMAQYQPTFWRLVHADWPATFQEVPVVLQVRAHVRATGNLVSLP